MDSDELSTTDEAHIASLLKAAGQREAIPEPLKQRWSNHFRQQLAQRRRQSQQRWLAACASVAMVAVMGLLFLRQPIPASTITVSQVTGNNVLILTTAKQRLAASGQVLTAGSTLSTGDASLLSINYHYFDLRLNAGTRLRIDSDRLTLLAGEVYVRSTRRSPGSGLIIATPFAIINDVGTQFTVRVTDDSVISTVRQGSILVQAGGTRTAASVTDNGAQQVTVNRRREIDIIATSASGDHWEWIYAVTPPYQLEGKSVYEFLRWSVQESGLTLRFDDERAEIYARTTVLHGDFPGLNPRTAVLPVLATTHLSASTDRQGLLTIGLPR